MKRSGQEWDLDEFLLRPIAGDEGERSPSPAELEGLLLPAGRESPERTARVCVGGDDGGGGMPFADVCGFGFLGGDQRVRTRTELLHPYSEMT